MKDPLEFDSETIFKLEALLANSVAINKELERKLRHALWAINSIRKLDISRTQASIIDVALEKIGAL